jgi:hypothetical protein
LQRHGGSCDEKPGSSPAEFAVHRPATNAFGRCHLHRSEEYQRAKSTSFDHGFDLQAAERVIVWLDEASETTETAFSFLEKLADAGVKFTVRSGIQGMYKWAELVLLTWGF